MKVCLVCVCLIAVLCSYLLVDSTCNLRTLNSEMQHDICSHILVWRLGNIQIVRILDFHEMDVPTTTFRDIAD